MSVPATSREIASPVRKAAILMIALGEEASADLMQRLSEAELKCLSEETSRLGFVTEEQTEVVLREFYQMSGNQLPPGRGGPEFMQKLLTRAVGPEVAKKIMRGVGNPPANSFAGLESMVKSDPSQVARFLNDEHPQTIALIISHLPPTQAVSLLQSLPPSLRTDVALRMARLDQISPEVVSRIATAVGERLKGVDSIKREAYGGVRAVAGLFNRLDPDVGKEILDGMDATDSALAESVRSLMFVFDDILKLDDAAMNEITGRVERKSLVLALKGTGEQIKEHFTKKMSSRARQMLMEDLDALGPVKIKEVETAQRQVIDTIRQLEQEGTISLRGSASDEYVS
ncbi:MAG: flagellar motor switch protein FliG [Acidobacteriota bacterium]